MTEITIALFHSGAREGTTLARFLAPSPRKLIELPHILEHGAGVLSADFRRPQRIFGLKVPGRRRAEPSAQPCHVPRFRRKPKQPFDQDHRAGEAGQNAPWPAAEQGQQPGAYGQPGSKRF